MQENKVVLFAGIGRLGVPVAKRLTEKGWKLAISYRSGRGSEKTVQQLKDELGEDKVLGIDAQVSDEKEAEKFVKEAFKKYGRIDALINISSWYPPEENWERWEKGERSDDDWKFYNSNFVPIRNAALAVIKKFNENPIGELSIINFADAYTFRYVERDVVDPYFALGKNIVEISLDEVKSLGFEQLKQSGAGNRDLNPYVLSKRDISYLTKTLAIKYQGGKIRINAIAPGPMLPPPDMTEEEFQPLVSDTLLKRWGFEGPIVKAIEYLLENSFVTGEIHKVDGGAELFRVAKKQGI